VLGDRVDLGRGSRLGDAVPAAAAHARVERRDASTAASRTSSCWAAQSTTMRDEDAVAVRATPGPSQICATQFERSAVRCRRDPREHREGYVSGWRPSRRGRVGSLAASVAVEDDDLPARVGPFGR
jgi:hypothetical protein